MATEISSQDDLEKEEVFEKAEFQLENLGLTWEDIEDNDVLDLGSGQSAIAHAVDLQGSTARVVSLDLNPPLEKWQALPVPARQRLVQSDAYNLPFAENSFDLVLAHASVGIDAFPEAIRVLRPGGEIRQYPLRGTGLWFISYYLDQVKKLPQEEVKTVMQNLVDKLDEDIDSLPNEYITLRDEALDKLSREQKIEVIGMLTERYSQLLNIPLTYVIKDPEAREPRATLIYKKPNFPKP